jgi:hypothetical protein
MQFALVYALFYFSFDFFSYMVLHGFKHRHKTNQLEYDGD